MISIDPKLLARSPEETSRQLGLGLLADADRALGRLERSEGGEALHDFRVALRRLRSLARAYKPHLKGSMGKKLRRRLRDLAASTNVARDAEVQIAWLTSEAPRLDPEARAGAEFLRERLQSGTTRGPSPEALREEFDALRKSLEKSLSRLRLRLDAKEASFLSATGALLGEAGVALEGCLAAVTSAADVDGLHRARIRTKRLRYLLEPLHVALADARALVEKTKDLQDVLGDLQDARVLAETISKELEKLALLGGEKEEALLALLRAQRDRRERKYLDLAGAWLGEASRPFFRDVAALAERLRALSLTPASHRRFRLASLPEPAKTRAPQSVREGFLPGRRVRERVQSLQSGRRTRYRRIVEVEGALPIEEALSRSDFEKLWALTEGRRIELLRYDVHEGERLWRIESIPAQELTLATGEPPLPDWLETLVVEDVTGSKKYDFQTLAKIHPKMD